MGVEKYRDAFDELVVAMYDFWHDPDDHEATITGRSRYDVKGRDDTLSVEYDGNDDGRCWVSVDGKSCRFHVQGAVENLEFSHYGDKGDEMCVLSSEWSGFAVMLTM